MEILLLYRSLYPHPPPPPPITPFCYPCLACYISFMESLIRKCYKFFFQLLNIFKECKRRGLMYCVYPDIYLFFCFVLHSCSLRFPFDTISLVWRISFSNSFGSRIFFCFYLSEYIFILLHCWELFSLGIKY